MKVVSNVTANNIVAAATYPAIPEITVFQINASFDTSKTRTPFIGYNNEKEDRVLIFVSA